MYTIRLSMASNFFIIMHYGHQCTRKKGNVLEKLGLFYLINQRLQITDLILSARPGQKTNRKKTSVPRAVASCIVHPIRG